MAGSWYNSGFEGVEKEEQRLDAARGPQRFWVPAGNSKHVVVVDDDPFCIHEHNPRINGQWRNPITCLQGKVDDVVCCQKLGPNSRYYAGFLTVVDCSEWVDKQGTKHQYEMRLLPCKLRSLKKLRRKKDEEGSLVAIMFKVTREDDKAAAIGDEWEKTRTVDLNKMFDHVCYRGEKLSDLWAKAESDAAVMERIKNTFDIKPEKGKLPREIPHFNYFEVLKPQSPKDLKILLGAVEVDDPGQGDSGETDMSSDDVPF